MKILVFSDLHLNEWKFGATILPNGLNSRLQDQLDVLKEIKDFCVKERIREVIFCGDLFHTHSKLSTTVLSCAAKALEDFRYTFRNDNGGVHFLVGNHDIADKAGKYHGLEWLKSLGHCEVYDEPKHHPEWYHDGLAASFLPFTDDRAVVEQFLKDVPENALVFMHQGVTGVPMGSGWVLNEILSANMIPDRVMHCFTGHYHAHTRVSDKLTIVGSTTHQNWNDVGNLSGWVVFDTETREFTHYESKAPKFRILDFGGIVAVPDNEWLFDHCNNNFIKVRNFNGYPDELDVAVKKAGARSVQWEEYDTQVNPMELRDQVRADSFDLNPFIDEIERELPDDEREIGRALREGRYKFEA
jgi:DNA repair exonuclease SbcCD nuclease subunit